MNVVTLANGRRFVADAGSVLDAALTNGLTLEHSCRSGRCGSCKVRVLEGSSAPLLDETSLTLAEIDAGWILTCAREAKTDLSLDTEDLSELAGLIPKTLVSRIDTLEFAAADVLKVRLRLPPNAALAFRAGQYLDMTGPAGLKRSYSIASGMNEPGIELHVRRVEGGAMSRYFFEQARPNDLLRFRGPLGTFFLRDVAGLDLIFLATGTGYAPIHSILAQLDTMPAGQRPRSTQLYWGGRLPQDIYADPVRQHPGLRFVPVLSRADRAWDGARGHVQNVLLSQYPSLASATVYACGSDAMIRATKVALCSAGLNPRRFHSDAFVSSN